LKFIIILACLQLFLGFEEASSPRKGLKKATNMMYDLSWKWVVFFNPNDLLTDINYSQRFLDLQSATKKNECVACERLERGKNSRESRERTVERVGKER
jgi:hypothetical protein